MSLDRLNPTLVRDVAKLEEEGRAKAPERVIVGYVPPSGSRGPRYRLEGNERAFIRAVDDVAKVARQLLDDLQTVAPKKNREEEAAKAKARAAERYARA